MAAMAAFEKRHLGMVDASGVYKSPYRFLSGPINKKTHRTSILAPRFLALLAATKRGLLRRGEASSRRF